MRGAQQSISVDLYRRARASVLDLVAKQLLECVPDAQVMRLAVETFDLTPKRPVLYVSGPMTGYPESNYPAFRECAQCLRAMGWTVVDPSEHFGGRKDLPRHKYLAADVAALITKCGGIVILDKWYESEGALLEVQIAVDRGYELFRWWGAYLGVERLDRKDVEGFLA